MRRKVNNLETHEIKRYYEIPAEKVQEWSDTIEDLTKQLDEYKAERESMISDYQKMLDLKRMLKDEINELKQENKALRLQADTYFDEWQSDSSLFGFLIENNVEFSIEDYGDVKVIEMGDWTEIHIVDNKYSVYHLRPCKSPIIKEFKSEKEVVNYLSNGVV